jgi:hypothetical protein
MSRSPHHSANASRTLCCAIPVRRCTLPVYIIAPKRIHRRLQHQRPQQEWTSQ